MKTFILGGIKSGKSRRAEFLASQKQGPVSVILTATAGDEEMAKRIDQHRRQRPPSWLTIEEPISLGRVLRNASSENPGQTIIIDCLTLWLTNLLVTEDETLLQDQLASFEKAVAECTSELIIVSNETNQGVVPMGELSRQFCDETGLLHQRIAALSDRVEWVVAGLPQVLKGNGSAL